MMAGCVGGWQGAVFCLFIGSLLGIAQAVVSRMGFGKNLPFGPALLSAAFIWLLGGDRWWFLYIRFFRRINFPLMTHSGPRPAAGAVFFAVFLLQPVIFPTHSPTGARCPSHRVSVVVRGTSIFLF